MPKKHILIAEDDTFLTRIYRENLQKEGVEVSIANNGEEAISIMDKRQPDLLVLDLLMPKTDGYGVLEHIQKKGYNFPVVVLSNLNRQTDESRTMAMGAKAFISKSEMELKKLSGWIGKYLNDEKN